MKAVSLLLKTVIAVYIGYLALSLLVLLPLMNFLAPHYVKEYTGRELRKDIILFDPFRVALELRGIGIDEHSGERFFELERGAVNLSLASLWREGLVFDEGAIEGLYVHVARQPDGDFNFSDMIPAGEEEPAPDDGEPASIPGITIETFRFHAERIEVSDYNQAREEPFTTHWDGLDIRASGLSTVVEEGRPYRLQAQAEAGGRLLWEGDVSLPGGYSEGSLELANVDLRVPWRFARPWLNFELASGRARVAGRYRVDWADAFRATVSGGEFSLTGVELRPRDAESLPDTHLRLGAFELGDISVDTAASTVQVASASVDGLDVLGWSEGSRASLADMLQPDLPAGEPAEPAADAGEPSPWQLGLGGFTLGDSRIGWRSEFTEPALVQVTPLDIRVGALAWPPAGDTPFELGLAVNSEARLDVDGAIDLDSGSGAVNYRLDALQLPWFNPNIPKAFKARITEGALSVAGDVELAGFAPTRLSQDGSVVDAHGVVSGDEQTLTGWDSLRWEKLAVDLQQRSVVLEKLALQGYTGRLHIYEDGTINTQRVLEQEIAAIEAEMEAEAEAAGDEPEPEDSGPPWSFSLPLVTIDASEVDFMDESMPIVFRTVIGELEGDISGISSAPGSVTTVDLNGSVDGYAPVKLGGTARPFDDPLALDLGLSFDGLDLVRLTPYSGTYAGRAIDRGTLTLEVQYKLEQSRLQGANSVRIDQLKLGDTIDSEEALDLPLDLAVALLTDVNGVIQLDVPVNGDINDPSFSLGAVIGGAFVNLITKAATAPFKLLASLVGSEDDLQRVTFAAGSTELDEVGQKKLMDLAGAMAQRPGIKLALDGRLHPQRDPEFLQRQALDAALLADGLGAESLKNRDDNWERAVAKRYQAVAAGGAEAPSSREQYRQLAARMPVDPAALEALMEERAVVVKRFLVTEGGIAADRSAIGLPDPKAEGNSFSGVEMSVDD